MSRRGTRSTGPPLPARADHRPARCCPFHNRRRCSREASRSSDSGAYPGQAAEPTVRNRHHRMACQPSPYHISPTVSHPLLLLIDLQPAQSPLVSSADQYDNSCSETALASGRLLPHKAYSSEAARKTHCSQATDSHSAAQETLPYPGSRLHRFWHLSRTGTFHR